MAAPKKKKLTQREKAENAAFKKRMQQEGRLPPDKSRLNRKKFAREVWAEYEKDFGGIEDTLYLLKAIGCMVGDSTRQPQRIGRDRSPSSAARRSTSTKPI